MACATHGILKASLQDGFVRLASPADVHSGRVHARALRAREGSVTPEEGAHDAPEKHQAAHE